jgi:hypothetical protein
MTIEEAMVSLSVQLEIKSRLGNEEAADALRLGIEALKRLQDNRKDPEFDHWVLLPGETEE